MVHGSEYLAGMPLWRALKSINKGTIHDLLTVRVAMVANKLVEVRVQKGLLVEQACEATKHWQSTSCCDQLRCPFTRSVGMIPDIERQELEVIKAELVSLRQF